MTTLLGLIFMGILTFIPPESATNAARTNKPKPKPGRKHKHHHKEENKKQQTPVKQSTIPKPKQPSSWDQIKNLLTCKQVEGSRVHDPSKGTSSAISSCGSMCSFRDVVHGNTRVVHRSDNSSPESSSLGQEARLLHRGKTGAGSMSSRSLSGSVRSGSSVTTTHSLSSRGMPLRKLSGCYECHMIVDPSRYPIIPRTTVCACPHCGEVFPKIESLEHHQAVRHAVSELGPEDSGRNIVEIIFKSSWLKKDSPMCKIERILKVQNTQRTIQRFEDCRDAVKLRANNNTKKNPRCAADGNELLRFHCTALTCSLGARGSSNLCGSVPGCGVCTIIRHGFQGNKGVRTTASSGRAHDCLDCTDGRRAMLVCRVIAGRVKRSANDAPAEEEIMSFEGPSGNATSYDSVAGSPGIYSNLEDLVVTNPKAILPCFVVIYKTLTTA
ncbi:uncharacterized protein LOC110688724 [Chenopodium quinoa]|uniref:C2H2-type domain-containing protein n=1 Tax=Chenopodium quinoa TaxID=63459 RepID=A0A803MV20_CHEQI|nr:uncharacterized protein LOC110688724 [Chenopodium quinoa]